jgi:hypothetical protein
MPLSIRMIQTMPKQEGFMKGGGFIGQGPLQPVPEPSTFLLIGAGLVGVGLLRKRFKS